MVIVVLVGVGSVESNSSLGLFRGRWCFVGLIGRTSLGTLDTFDRFV